MRYLIIGNSAAAIGAVESIRPRDREGEITILSKEPYYAYSRPLITEYIADVFRDEDLTYRGPDFYRENRIQVHLGIKARAVNPKNRVVLTEDGTEHPYDRLLIATGGTPIVPPIKGLDKEGVFTCTTWDDSKAIKALLPRVKRAVVVGGGLIGVKAAEGLYEAGVHVTIVELLPHIMGRILDAEGAYIFEAYLKGKGLGIITGETVVEALGNGRVEGVRLASGDTLPCDFLIIAVGVRPNVEEVVEGSGIRVNQGILVDRHMRTSVPDVYAAGDVAEGDEMLVREKRVIALWPVAYRQGKIAGLNMAGEDREYEGGFPQNTVSVLGLTTITIGFTEPPEPNGYKVLMRRGPGENDYKKLIFKGDVLEGAILVNSIDRAGILTGLIRARTEIGSNKERLLDTRLGLTALPRAWRKEKLTQPV
ncbi:MAG: NAD(P)/FAD-dependent oxidoreductase [candidate division NC10 bacterium]|nr:NAD(P)/FAD-dependent oxidoreductase [candidate division NC10 bacterium]